MPQLQRVQVALASIAILLAPASALAASQASIHVTGSCAGDTVTGRVMVRAPKGARFTVRLSQQRYPRARWALTRTSKAFISMGGRRVYRVRFDVVQFDAYAYRLRVDRSHQRTFSRPIPAALCAPGKQVPEAPFALLLPLSLLGTGGLLLLRRSSARA
jgi:hypothetical protein